MRPPAPFIVGAPRSGTTLLRLMLDSHSQLALPPETGFIPAAAEAAAAGADGRRALWRTLVEFETWPDTQLSSQELWDALAAIPAFTVAEGLRTFYRLYAARFSKSRWGDKTPAYAFHMATIRTLLPESRFIHLIRDGRDVALSLRGLWFDPGEAVEDRALAWRRWIDGARSQRELCRPYLEVRYEDLVLDGERVLRAICEHIEIPFEGAMMEYHRRAPARLEEHEERYAVDGSVRLTRDQRREQQRRTESPLDPTRVGRWRREMVRDELERFEKVAGETLRALNYETLR